MKAEPEKKMKYIVLLGDGMADDPQAERGSKTPLELADTPNMDRIADRGRIGLARTVPDTMEPGSDVANLSILGYDPEKFYAGRAAIEAAALGIRLGPDETALRCNLVTLGGEGPDRVMSDYSGGHPTADEQRAIVESLSRELGNDTVRFVPGVSFRNICILRGFTGSPSLKPPHDHAGERVRGIMPSGPGAELIAELTLKSQAVLSDHPVNRARVSAGKAPINSIWLWGLGRFAAMPSFRERHGLSGAVITGVDLVRGLARLLDLEVIPVPGATGYVDTNFEGKARAALEALTRVDFVFLHVEAPDEAGHEGDLDLKVRAITDFDNRTVGPVLDGLSRFPDYRVLVMPDHETPVKERGHRGRPVPYAVASKADLEKPAAAGRGFNEKAAREKVADPEPAPALLEARLFCC
jgi:2,3-bisphosphoglycerate-independent phosphoglycerate mutase